MTLSDLKNNVLFLLTNSKVNLGRDSEKKRLLLDTIGSIFDDMASLDNAGANRIVVMKPTNNPLDRGKGIIAMTESESGRIDGLKKKGNANVVDG